MNIGDLLTVACYADESTLLMSRRDCHATDVDSIVVANNHGRLLRAFIAWPGHKLWKNVPGSVDYAVGIHDHRYDLVFRGLAGEIFNHTFTECDLGESHFQFEFMSGVSTGNPTVKQIGEVGLAHTECTKLSQDTPIPFPANRLHTVEVKYGFPAAWLVSEGPKTKTTTTLYTKTPWTTTQKLYRPFESRDDVIETIRKFKNDYSLD